MNRQEFNFELPPELIAQYPLSRRSDSRLLIYHQGKDSYEHCLFKDIISYLHAGDLLVLNDTKVINARLFGQKITGGQVEILIERVVDNNSALVQIKSSKAIQLNTIIRLSESYQLRVVEKNSDLYRVEFIGGETHTILNELGHIPLPPYIKREDNELDLNDIKRCSRPIPDRLQLQLLDYILRNLY